MKKKSLFRMMQEGAEARLRRLCGRIPAHLRLYVVLTMLLFFAFLANYVFFGLMVKCTPERGAKMLSFSFNGQMYSYNSRTL